MEKKKSGQITPPDFKIYYHIVAEIQTGICRRNTQTKETGKTTWTTVRAGAANRRCLAEADQRRDCRESTRGREQMSDLNLDLTAYTKMNSKRTVDLNVKHTTRKLLEDYVRENIWEVGHGKGFLEMTPNIRLEKERNRWVGFCQNENFCSVKDHVERSRLEKIFANHLFI